MNWQRPRPDFFVAHDFFEIEEARDYLNRILTLGQDAVRGFHHPDLKPNRFHARPKYPVDHYMGLGLYWNPLDYLYHPSLPDLDKAPHPIPEWLQKIGKTIVLDCFPATQNWQAQAVLVNYYTQGRKMGWHVDKEEQDKQAPVVGLNFGGTARFYYETLAGKEESILIPGNSVYCFGGSARLMRHAVGGAYKKSLSFESSGLLKEGERVNLTLRKVWA
ncbi:MAG: alpha-ketoglutarate-dependent dioxygenase AlkB [Bacteriovoracia bacterium]